MNTFEESLNYDKVSNIIIDLGLKLTKIGFGSESEPRKIIPTPKFFDYDRFIQEDAKKHLEFLSTNINTPESNPNLEKAFSENNYVTLLSYKKDSKDLKFTLEAFIYNILYTILQLKKQQRDKNYVCLLCIDFTLDQVLKDIYELITKIILDNPLIHSIRLLPKTILPIFTSGYASGIVIDLGYINTTITPINNGYPYLNKSMTLSIGAVELEKSLQRSIIEENIINGKKKIKNVENFCNNLPKYLDDLVVRCTVCISKKISLLLNDEVELAKLKSDQDYSKVDYCKDMQDFQVSFLTRVRLGEKLFNDGETNSDQINIAYSLLKVIQSLNCEDRKKLSQNVVLSGGSSMLIGFYRRLIEEINFWIDMKEFEDILVLKMEIKVHKIIFPRNCLTWIGASLVSGFEKLNIKNLTITKEDLDISNSINSNSNNLVKDQIEEDETKKENEKDKEKEKIVINKFAVEKILNYFK